MILKRELTMDYLNLYLHLIELNNDGMYIYSLDGVILFANNGVSRLLELDCKGTDLIGRRMEDIIIYTQKKGTIRSQLAKTGRAKDMKYYFKTLKGNFRCVINNSILWKEEKTDEQYVVCVVKDITSLEMKTEELDSVNKQMDVTLSSIGEAVIATDSKSCIVNMNHAAENITNASLSTECGKPLSDIIQFMSDSEELSSGRNIISKVISQESLFGPMRLDAKICKSNIYIRVIVNASPIINSAGKKIGVVISFRDISEIIRLEEQLRHSQKMDSIGRLSGGLAHDFNNQLSIIRGCIDLIGLESNGYKKHSEFVEMAQEAIDQAEGTVSQLLTFARQSNPVKEILDLHHEIFSAVKLMKHSFAPEIEIFNECVVTEKMIYGNPNQIHNVLINIFVNSRDSILKEGKITIKSRNCVLSKTDVQNMGLDLKSGKYIEITIKDNGHGMKKNVLERIFDPFFTTKELGKGTGLGLSVVYGIIKEHSSEIKAFSESGVGTKIKIWFPILSDIIKKSRISAELEMKKFSGKILLVDDEKPILKIYSKLLRNIGFEVLTAVNGKEGVKIFQEYFTEIDIVIMDVMMPEMGGLEAFNIMKKINKDVKLIFITGYANSENNLELLKCGVDVVYKPARFETLYSAIKKVMSGLH